jgi:hypothetical protein
MPEPPPPPPPQQSCNNVTITVNKRTSLADVAVQVSFAGQVAVQQYFLMLFDAVVANLCLQQLYI